MDPRIYQAWINHIVERGNIVIYPLYQGSLLTPVKDFTPNAIAAVQDAIRTLKNEPGHVKPELDKFGIVGHSMGGPISANMAALWKTQGLPFPCAVMCVEPGNTWKKPAWATMELADLSRIPPETLLLTVTGDQDHLVRDIDAKRIFNESTQVPLTNKNYITLISDDHGHPALKANHMVPVAWAQMPGETQQENNAAGPLRQMLKRRMDERRDGDNEMPNFRHMDTQPHTLMLRKKSGQPRNCNRSSKNQKTNMPMAAQNISKVTNTIETKDNFEGICFRMIFLSELTSKMPINKKGASKPLMMAVQ